MPRPQRSDADIAGSATNMIHWNASLTAGATHVVVEDGDISVASYRFGSA
jgi:hypothetical protein